MEDQEITLQILKRVQAQQKVNLPTEFPEDDPRGHWAKEELEKTRRAIEWVENQ